MKTPLALLIAFGSLATPSCMSDDEPAGSEPVPAVLRLADGSELVLDTSAAKSGLEFTGENERVSFRLVVSDIEVEKQFSTSNDDAEENPFVLEVTEEGMLYRASDLYIGEWRPKGEGHYTGGFVWDEGSYNSLLVGERITRRYRCIFDEFGVGDYLCMSQEREMFSHEELPPLRDECPGAGTWEEGDCESISAASCSLPGGPKWYLLQAACEEAPQYLEELQSFECEGGLQTIGAGCTEL